ncbi:hypothetical protein CHARACLAT_030423 [Characodon lateralis]|uniref:Uncharacterized protein n=1 Tax=Characodon lateralis TaxID=208331 RepID=A0ABU7D572_9TELE|nr:hypothetical protein [Characodon lateralis]
MEVVHSLIFAIHTLYSKVQVPIPHRDNQPPDPGCVSLGVDTGRPPQHLNLVRASPSWCPNLSNPGKDTNPQPQRPPSLSREGATYKRGVYMAHTSPPTRATTE